MRINSHQGQSYRPTLEFLKVAQGLDAMEKAANPVTESQKPLPGYVSNPPATETENANRPGD
jgi:hypothetical protein